MSLKIKKLCKSITLIGFILFSFSPTVFAEQSLYTTNSPTDYLNLASKPQKLITETLQEATPSQIQASHKINGVQAIPETDRQLYYTLQLIQFQKKSKLKQLLNQLNHYEHRNSGENTQSINQMRKRVFYFIQGSTLLVWSASSMSWDMKAVAMMVSTVSNYFFIMYENTLDEKIYDRKMLRKIFEVPKNTYYKALAKINKLTPGFERLGRMKSKNFGENYGKILGITMVNYVYLYLYKYLNSPGSGMFTEEIFMRSLESLAVFFGTSAVLQGVRGNVKANFRSILSEMTIQKTAMAINLLAGTSFLILAADLVPAEYVAAGLGIPSFAMYWLTGKERVKKFFSKRIGSCKSAFARQ